MPYRSLKDVMARAYVWSPQDASGGLPPLPVHGLEVRGKEVAFEHADELGMSLTIMPTGEFFEKQFWFEE